MPKGTHPLAGLPDLGYVSPLASMGYPMLEASAEATVGLQNPDAILGAVPIGSVTAIVYVEKQLDFSTTDNCMSTPSWALTNIDTGHPRGANTDVITIRVATTTDGINFTNLSGAASGLQDPTSTAFNGIRWLGSGSLIALSNGHYGMFFGAGNCLDNDSDGFHFIGYAETVAEVESPSDLQNWTVIYGFDNPILSTDTVTDPGPPVVKYPANPPLIDVTGSTCLRQRRYSPGSVLPLTERLTTRTSLAAASMTRRRSLPTARPSPSSSPATTHPSRARTLGTTARSAASKSGSRPAMSPRAHRIDRD